MNILRSFIVLIAVSFLFSCYPKKPDLSGTEVPAGPLLNMLEQQRIDFTSLNALAHVEVVRGGRKRAFDTVGIILDGQQRLRLEAFGPLGESVFALVWDGTDVLVRLPDDDRVKRPGQAGIERVTGIRIEAKEFCALLSGTSLQPARPQDAHAYCAQDGFCVVELTEGDSVRRIRVQNAQSGKEGRIFSQERYQSDMLVYRVRYEPTETRFPAPLFTKVVLENPERGVLLTVEYREAEMNAPVVEGAFVLTDREERTP